MFHPTIKFTAEYSKEAVNILDLNIKNLLMRNLRQICLLNLQILISFLVLLLPILISVKKEYLTVKLRGLIGSAQIMRTLITL